jgi:hypothetical protein
VNRPILFLDVDGVLNPFAGKPERRPDGYETHRITPAGWGAPLRVWLNPSHGPMLLDLAERAGIELVWATTWEHQANEQIGPRIGLPELPVVEFGSALSSGAWKWAAVAEYADGRPLAWFDDDFQAQPARLGFDLARRNMPTRLCRIDPAVGLVQSDLDAVEKWANDLAPVDEVLYHMDGGRMVATIDYVRQVEHHLCLDDRALSQRIADFTVAEIERVGKQSAVMYFDDLGQGPFCSWCGQITGLCSHVMRNGPIPSNTNKIGAPTAS